MNMRNRNYIVGLFLSLSVLCCSLFVTTPAQAQIARAGWTSIVSANSGKCIDIAGMSSAQDAPAVEWPCQFSVNEQFMVHADNTGFRIVELQTNQCLVVHGASTAPGAKIVQDTCNGQPGEHWTITAVGTSWQIKSLVSGLCMTGSGGSGVDNTAIVQISCTDPTAMTWIFKSGLVTPTQAVTLQANNSGQCLTVSTNSSTAVAQNPCAGVPAEQWTVVPKWSAYELVSSSGACLDNPASANGVPLLNPCTAGITQLFYMWPDTQGAFYIQSASSFQCFDVSAASVTAGAAIVESNCTTVPDQQWSISFANVQSAWTPVIPLTSNPIAIANLPNGQLLTWGTFDLYGYESDIGMNYGSTYYSTFDPVAQTSAPSTLTTAGADMFCPGTANLPDGRILANGGSSSPKTTIFNPATMTWTADAAMNIPRGYEGTTPLSNGSVFTLGGSWSGNINAPKSGELWTKGSGWTTLTNIPESPILGPDPAGIFRADNHLWLFAGSNGAVFHAGPSAAMHWITTSGTGTITSAGNRADDAYSVNGNAVMYDVNKILKSGGAPAYDYGTATPAAYTINISGGLGSTPTVTKIAPMAFPRAFSNGVVLPTGQVLEVGGQTFALAFTDTGAILTPELWDPLTGVYKQLAPMQTPRTYHSTALLLKDGRVFVGGGGQCGNGCPENHFNAEILTPPYLLNADGSAATRPTITTAPATVTAGSYFNVTTNSPIVSFAMMRMSSTTHTVNNDQRRIPLTIAADSGTTYTIALPGDRGITLPGYYMLFAINAQDVPSVAATVLVQ